MLKEEKNRKAAKNKEIFALIRELREMEPSIEVAKVAFVATQRGISFDSKYLRFAFDNLKGKRKRQGKEVVAANTSRAGGISSAQLDATLESLRPEIAGNLLEDASEEIRVLREEIRVLRSEREELQRRLARSTS